MTHLSESIFRNNMNDLCYINRIRSFSIECDNIL